MAPPGAHIPALRELRNDRGQIEAFVDEILDAIDRNGYPKASRFAVKLAVEEALTNAFQHGHRGLPPQTPARVGFTVTREDLSVVVEDQGPGFDPRAVPDPSLDENLANPHGRGLMLMQAYMTRVTHNQVGNRVELYYRRPGSSPSA